MNKDCKLIVAQISEQEKQELKKIAKTKGMLLSGLMGALIRQEINSNKESLQMERKSGTPSPFNSPKESHSGSELDHRGEGVPFDSTLFRGEHTSL